MKPTTNQPSKNVGKKAKIVQNEVTNDLLTSLDSFFDKKLKLFFYISLALTTLFAAMLFEVRVSLTGDDAMYIIRASDFIHEFKYPDFQGPLYPIVLSPFVLIFGINVLMLKLVSFVFILLQTTFFYFAFKKKVPASLLVISMILSSLNAYLLYFASQTYNEAFFMVLQSLFFLFFFKYYIVENEGESATNLGIKTDIKQALIIGLLLVLMGLTRSIGYVALAAVILYFIFDKKWIRLAYSIGSFSIFYFLFQGLKSLLWNDADVQFKNQANSLLLKNYYNAAQGNEDFAGYLMRIVDNSQLYISKHLYMMFGLRPDLAIQPNITTLTIITYAIFIVAIVLVFKQNRFLFFTGIYLVAMMGATFLVLQKTWDQGRFIVTYLPLIILFLFSAFYYLSKLKNFKMLQFLPYLLAVILLFSSFARTSERSKITRDILSKNLNGNMLYGFTPDWTHYLQMSKWAAENIPDSLGVACRKPSISFIYGEGREFIGIFRMLTTDLNTALIKVKNTDAQVLAVNMRELEEKKVPAAIVSALRIMTHSFVTGSKKDANGNDIEYYLYGVYRVPWESVQGIVSILDEYGVFYSLNAEVFDYIKTTVKNGETVEFSAISPDDLLNDLKVKKVKYVIMASLRKNPNVKDGMTINTVDRYLYFIQLKYPSAFRIVNQIGDNEDEPAQLIEVLYSN